MTETGPTNWNLIPFSLEPIDRVGTFFWVIQHDVSREWEAVSLVEFGPMEGKLHEFCADHGKGG